jgi:ribosomal protein S27AE
VIEAIEEEERTKPVYSCRRCGFASIKARKTVNPRFLCFKCGATFDEPDTKSKPVTTYRSHHDVAWVDLPGTLAGADLRALCERPRSQLSLRPLRFADFRDAVIRQLGSDPLTSVELRAGAVAGGHRTATARIRIGQADFRRRLLDEFGSVCAITGPAPGSALEAGHLYSYSAVGKHHDRGGLLLRRDIHRLFDLGDIAVNPSTMTVDVVPSLLSFPVYAVLAGRPLAVPVAAGHRRWLVDHWREHRLPEPS